MSYQEYDAWLTLLHGAKTVWDLPPVIPTRLSQLENLIEFLETQVLWFDKANWVTKIVLYFSEVDEGNVGFGKGLGLDYVGNRLSCKDFQRFEYGVEKELELLDKTLQVPVPRRPARPTHVSQMGLGTHPGLIPRPSTRTIHTYLPPHARVAIANSGVNAVNVKQSLLKIILYVLENAPELADSYAGFIIDDVQGINSNSNSNSLLKFSRELRKFILL
ncbi:hypothetical protein HK098_006037 [Nowakowskiella sp. JEL0407]|nr:hypothetical protein HK098_006037 [Nowakowskiella sp. JEL0407]